MSSRTSTPPALPRLQSEIDIMEHFLRFPPFNIKSMLMGG